MPAEAPPVLGRHRSVSGHRFQSSLLRSQAKAHVMTHKMDSLPSAMASLDDLSVDNKDSNSGQGLFIAREIPATPTNDHLAFPLENGIGIFACTPSTNDILVPSD